MFKLVTYRTQVNVSIMLCTREMQNALMNYVAVISAMTVLSSSGRAATGRQYHHTVYAGQ